MAHRSFSAAREQLLADRPTFDLQNESFTCKPAMSIAGLAHAVDALQEATSAEAVTAAAISFFDKVLIKADRDKMHTVLEEPEDDDDDAVPVSARQVTEIVRWLVEVYTGNPQGQSSGSGDGQPSTGLSSKDEPSIEASTSSS